MRRRRRSSYYGAGLAVILIALLLVQWRLDVHWGSNAWADAKAEAMTAFPTEVARKISPRPNPTAASNTAGSSFLSRFRSEVAIMGVSNEDPSVVEDRLQVIGQNLKPSEISELRELIMGGMAGADETALALDLLGRSPDVAAADTLVAYILQGPDIPSREVPTFQLLALESLMNQAQLSGDPKSLRKVQLESRNPLLSQRATQALGAMKGQNPWPRETDESSLRDLLDKPAANRDR